MDLGRSGNELVSDALTALRRAFDCLGRLHPGLALAAIVALGAGCGRRAKMSPEAESRRWREGITYRYRVVVESHSDGAAAPGRDLEFRAEAALTPVRAAGAYVELLILLENPRIAPAAGRAPSADDAEAAAVRSPYLLTLQRGRLTETRSSPGLPRLATWLLRGLASAFEVVPPPRGASGWSLSEEVPTSDVPRQRTLAFGAARAGGAALGDGPGSTRATLTVSLEGSAPAASGEPDREALLRQTVPHGVDDCYGADPWSDTCNRGMTGRRSFEGLLTELEVASARAQREERGPDEERRGVEDEGDKDEREPPISAGAIEALIVYLRDQPDCVARVESRLRGGSPAAPWLVEALTAAGSDAAQRVLAELASDRKLSLPLRSTAAHGLARLRHANGEALAALERLLADPPLRREALGGLGTAARRLRAAGEVATSRALAARLRDALDRARDTDEIIRCLHGVESAADPDALPSIVRRVDAGSPRVRAAAVYALHLIEGPTVDAVIARVLADDAEADVRATAVRITIPRAPSGPLRDAIARVGLRDPEQQLRAQAVALLGRWTASYPALRTTLQQIAATDGRAEIRAAAARALQST